MRWKTRGIAAVIAGAVAAAWTGFAAGQTVAISTLPPGAINNIQAGVVAKVVQEHSDLQMRLVTFNNPAAINGAAQNGQSEFSFTSADEAAYAYNGLGTYEGKAMTDLRVAFTVFPFRVGAIVRNNSDIKTVMDLKGKRIASEWSGFKQGIDFWNAMLGTEGMTLDDAEGVPTTDLLRAADDFKAGKTDAFTFAVGGPKVAEINSAIEGGVRFLSFRNEPDALAGMQAVREEFHIAEIQPQPNWPGIIGPTNVMEYYIVLMVNQNVPGDIIKKVLQAVYDNKEAMVAGHPSFNAFTQAGMAADHKGRIVYHPASIEFFKEKGIWKE
jgi:TRAP transporter TAXI family solute receptor